MYMQPFQQPAGAPTSRLAVSIRALRFRMILVILVDIANRFDPDESRLSGELGRDREGFAGMHIGPL